MTLSRISAATLAAVLAATIAASTTTVVDAFVVPRQATPFTATTTTTTELDAKKRVVVIGNGMVGQRFMEKLLEDTDPEDVELATFCEEPRAAYNRVRLTSYFETRDPSALTMTSDFDDDGTTSWYKENNVELFIGDKAIEIDTQNKIITGESGKKIEYDACVLATGSFPFVPPIPGKQRPGVFVYRTIEDLEAMLEYSKANNVKSAAVIGGGLLGLEAAKAAKDMGLISHVIEFADILMCRQIDQGGHNALVGKIEEMGLKVHCGARTESFVGQDGTTDMESLSPVSALRFSNEEWDDLPVEMVIVSAGIKPRDELARSHTTPDGAIALGERGGIVVDSQMRTSADSVYAIGEIALYDNFIYGLIAPGYTMAGVCAKVVSNDLLKASEDELPGFYGADMSTKLKLLGCDVASFGVNQPGPDDEDVQELVWNDPFTGVYRKLIFNKAGTLLRGGILIGDASDYDKLHKLAVSAEHDGNPAPLPEGTIAAQLLPPASAKSGGGAEEEDETDLSDPNVQICSCNDVSVGQLKAAIHELGVDEATLPVVKKCSKAGTGCGGCEPAVKAVLAAELELMGGALSNNLCEHFEYSRQELMTLIRMEDDPTKVESFEQILAKHGSEIGHKHGDGCEICKPAVGSILSSLQNKLIVSDDLIGLQETNDRALANMQRGGTYSVVPRVPGGELTPDQLIALGDVANKYQLYSKVTGAQRIDLFGAAKHELPDIWEQLGKAGFESGHAYGKSLRTVKSCVGSTWCRYGVQDSVGFAVRVENRYKGIRSPHKMKSGVSGCARECAEAMGKDFGMIATENGYNLYVGGNGGAIPVQAELLASDIDEDTLIKYVDRYLMYYILTADRLERTAHWQKKLPGGKDGTGGPIAHLKEVIIEDYLGICEELDTRMALLVDTYHDEWAEVVNNPELRKRFSQFANTEENIHKEDMLEFVDIRGQTRPADWAKDGQPQTNWESPPTDVFSNSEKSWVDVGSVTEFLPNIGTPVLYGDTQLAVFNNVNRGEWYVTQNMCPHKQAFVLSQGIVGDKDGSPKVACPLHKKQFSLETGEGIGDEPLNILTFPVMTVGGRVLTELPATAELDAILGTHGLRVQKSDCIDIAGDAKKLTSATTNTTAVLV